ADQMGGRAGHGDRRFDDRDILVETVARRAAAQVGRVHDVPRTERAGQGAPLPPGSGGGMHADDCIRHGTPPQATSGASALAMRPACASSIRLPSTCWKRGSWTPEPMYCQRYALSTAAYRPS